MRILIVDDDTDIRLLVRMQVEVLDGVASVAEAANGAEALELAGRGDVDLVILDVDMPVLSGEAALPRLRALAPAATIVMHSASRPTAGRPGFELADFHLQKLRDDVGEFVGALLARVPVRA